MIYQRKKLNTESQEICTFCERERAVIEWWYMKVLGVTGNVIFSRLW